MAGSCLSSALSLVSLDRAGAGAGVRDSRGWTGLHLAARHSKPQTVRRVLQQGGRVGDRDQEGNTPLHLAAESGNKEGARVLLHHGASITERNRWRPVHMAGLLCHLLLPQRGSEPASRCCQAQSGRGGGCAALRPRRGLRSRADHRQRGPDRAAPGGQRGLHRTGRAAAGSRRHPACARHAGLDPASLRCQGGTHRYLPASGPPRC